jgi:hypothetical protein
MYRPKQEASQLESLTKSTASIVKLSVKSLCNEECRLFLMYCFPVLRNRVPSDEMAMTTSEEIDHVVTWSAAVSEIFKSNTKRYSEFRVESPPSSYLPTLVSTVL